MYLRADTRAGRQQSDLAAGESRARPLARAPPLVPFLPGTTYGWESVLNNAPTVCPPRPTSRGATRTTIALAPVIAPLLANCETSSMAELRPAFVVRRACRRFRSDAQQRGPVTRSRPCCSCRVRAKSQTPVARCPRRSMWPNTVERRIGRTSGRRRWPCCSYPLTAQARATSQLSRLPRGMASLSRRCRWRAPPRCRRRCSSPRGRCRAGPSGPRQR